MFNRDLRRQHRQTFHMARRIIGSLVNELRQIDQRLGTLAAAIPKPGEQFELLEEIGDGVRCVRGDLLADAIETLESLAYLDDDLLYRRRAERQRLLPQGAILDAYNANRDVSIDLALESGSVATALHDLMNGQKDWQGTAAELLTQLEERATERAIKARTWPKNAQALSGRLKRAATFLRKVGIEVRSERGARSTSEPESTWLPRSFSNSTSRRSGSPPATS